MKKTTQRRKIMPNYQQSQIANLKAKISQLQAEKEQLRLLVHELIEVFCKISQKPSSTWTFSPDLATLFKNLADFKANCSHSQTSNNFTSSDNNFNEGNWDQMKDIFAKMKGEHE